MSLSGNPVDCRIGPAWSTVNLLGPMLRAFGGTAAAPASTAWPTANQAYLIPFQVPSLTTFLEMYFMAGTTPGTTNFDLGVYSEGFTLLRSLGATAAVNTTDALLPVGGGAFTSPLVLPRGRYYMAMSSASIALTVRASVVGNSFFRAMGMQTMAAAHPLPATATPASMGTTAFMPTLTLATVTNAL